MVTVRPLAAADHDAWAALYAGYAEFYQVEQTAEMRARVWSWLLDGTHELEGFIAVDEAGEALGIAHYRPFARPLAASVGGFLDDLFVAPSARGREIGKRLIAAIVDVAKQRGWTVVRWLTAENNYRARSSYDKVATATKWLTYEIRTAV